jgi:hypothetical protein
VPFYLEGLLALPVQVAGILMTALPLSIAVLAPISGRDKGDGEEAQGRERAV